MSRRGYTKCPRKDNSSGAVGTNLVVNEEEEEEEEWGGRRERDRNAWNDGIQFRAGGESEAR